MPMPKKMILVNASIAVMLLLEFILLRRAAFLVIGISGVVLFAVANITFALKRRA
jgi:hypothetical protein